METFIERSGIVINQNNSSIANVFKSKKIGLIVLLIGVVLLATSLLFKSEVVYLGKYNVPYHQTIDGEIYESPQSKAFLFFDSSLYFSILSSLIIFIIGVLLLIGVNDVKIKDRLKGISIFLLEKSKSFSTSFPFIGLNKWYQNYASQHTRTIKDLNEKELEEHRVHQLKERRLEKRSNWIWIFFLVGVVLTSKFYNSTGSASFLGLFLFISIIPQLVRDKGNRSSLFITLWFIGLAFLIFMISSLTINNYIIEKLNNT
ncbi:hypothetical protein [Nonlabens xiamenensis]|uniref:hypothetical protein n=1 Tax=Nonlabens xiamenensis TaxID=2341043 RepID=UPI000F6052BE|nr:hypothetical protein [Nonlabens xiamenensis]